MRRTTLALALALSSCGGRVADPRPQWVLVATTDAPMPRFGDRVLIEVLRADGSPACPGCRREIGVATADLPLSFGVVPPEDGSGTLVRARLYRSWDVDESGGPAGTELIDQLAPLSAPHGDDRRLLFLSMSCFGVAASVTDRTSCDPSSGRSTSLADLPPAPADGAAPQPASWPHAAPVPCPSPAPAGMACIPGQAYLLGAPDFPPGLGLGTSPQHLVLVPPFFLDVHEMTVGELSAVADALDPKPLSVGQGLLAHCTFGGPSPTAPVNCVTRDTASQACAALGKRLPTEAEWELAASGGDNRYPWGSDDDVCGHAYIARGDVLQGNAAICWAGMASSLGPTPVGSTPDVTPLGVHDLGGNVSEWVSDSASFYTDPCWSGATPLVSPMCSKPGSPGVVRGGSWSSLPAAARAVARFLMPTDTADAVAGFRCARSAQ